MKINIKKKGFTLLEVMIALSMLLIVIASSVSLFANSFDSVRESRNKIIANYLAQEAIEYIRRVRDNNALSLDDWLKDLNPCTSSGGASCRIDVFADDVQGCGGSCLNTKIKYDSARGRYQYTNGSDTIFSRNVSLDEITNNVETKIVATVQWTYEGNTKRLVLQEHIFNWR